MRDVRMRETVKVMLLLSDVEYCQGRPEASFDWIEEACRRVERTEIGRQLRQTQAVQEDPRMLDFLIYNMLGVRPYPPTRALRGARC